MTSARNFVTAAVMLGLLALAQWQTGRFVAFRETAWVPPSQPPRERWDPAVVRAVALGHAVAAADALWLRFLQDTSLSRVPRGTLSTAFLDLDLATSLDPAFFEAYASGVPLLAVVRDDIDGALRLLEKAEAYVNERLPSMPEEFRRRHWNDTWMLSIVAGYLHLFERDDLVSAAEAFLKADAHAGAPAYVRRLAERLRAPGGIYDVGSRVIAFLASRVTEPALRAKYERQMVSLNVARFLDGINREFPGGRGMPERDPWGGRLFVGADGRIDTTTPRERVFGLK